MKIPQSFMAMAFFSGFLVATPGLGSAQRMAGVSIDAVRASVLPARAGNSAPARVPASSNGHTAYHRVSGLGKAGPCKGGCLTTRAPVAVPSWTTGDGIIDHWNGSEWRSVAGATIPGGVSWQLEAVAAIPNTKPVQLLAVGWTGKHAAPENTDNSYALIEHWNGSQWIRMTPAPKASKGVELDGVTAVSTDDAWAVGPNGIIEHWNGKAWSRVRSAGGYRGRDGCESLDAVAAVSVNNVYAVGYDTYYCQGGSDSDSDFPYAMIEHWNGSSWRFVNAEDKKESEDGVLNAVTVSAGDVWAVGYTSDDNGNNTGALIQRWNGTSWTDSVGAVGDPTASLWGVAALSSASVWAVGQEGAHSFVEQWDGAAWQATPSQHPALDDSLAGVAAIPGTSLLWAVGQFVETLSTGGGKRFATQSVPELDNSLAAASSVPGTNRLWAVGQSGSEPLLEQWDGGSWTITPGPAVGVGLNGVLALSQTDVWAVGAGGLIEHWNGTGWVETAAPVYETADLEGLSAVSATDIWAVGGSLDISPPVVEHWNGTQWSSVPVPLPSWSNGAVLESVDAIATDDVWAVGIAGTKSGTDNPIVEHWNGQTWTAVASPSVSGAAELNSVSAAGPNDVWAVGRRLRVLHRSYGLIERWNGRRWSVVASPSVATNLASVTTVSPKDAWAVGVSGSIPLYDPDSGETWVRPGTPGLIEHWNGHRWTVSASPSPAAGSNFEGVAANGSSVWAVGSYVSTSGANQTLTERLMP